MRGVIKNCVRACVAFALALLPVLAGQGTAQAHAVVVATSPAGWAVAATSPAEVSLTFSEPVELGLATVRVVGPAGDMITTAAPAHPDGKPEVLAVSVPRALSDGTYTVNWQVTSADSHPVHGAFVFSVGQPSKSAESAPVQAGSHADADRAVLVSYGTARWLSFAGLALLAGAAFFVVWCQATAAVGRRVRVLLWSGWWSLLAATVLVLLLYGPYATGRSLSAATDLSLITGMAGTRLGVAMLSRLLLLGMVGTALLWFLRRNDNSEATVPQRRRRGAAVLAATCALAVTWSAASHSAAGELAGLAMVADTAHLTAMAVWLGGLVVLGTVVRSADATAMRVAVPRFSLVALTSVVVLVVTGVFQSWRLVGTPSALIGTSYGQVLLGKVALTAVLLAFGAAARRWVQRHYDVPVISPADRRRAARGPGHAQLRRFGTVVAAEAGIAAMVLGLTAVLVNTSSAAAELATQSRQAAQSQQAEVLPTAPGQPVVADFDAGGAAGRGKVAVLVAPATAGNSEVHLAVLDERGQPREVAEVQATMSHPERSPGPLTVPLRYGGVPGHYISDPLSLPVSGRWEMSLKVRTSDVDEAIVHVSVGIP